MNRRFGILLAGVFIAAASLQAVAAAAASSCLPPGEAEKSRIYNVRNFGAKGDGITDDTLAFQRALSEQPLPQVDEARKGTVRIVYVPDGIYRVSDTLHWRTSYERYMVLQGQSRAGTVIKLMDSAPLFADTLNPKPVVSTLRAEANQRDSFRNSIYDLTIDTGKSNPGAAGIDYMTNNTGGIGNVTIKSSDPNGVGAAGLRLTQEAHGPSLIKNVEIDGFDTGIDAMHDEFGAVFEHLTLSGQRKVGIRNTQFILTLRDVTSSNAVPVIDNQGEAGFVQVIGGHFTNGARSETAVRSSAGFLHLRDITSNGYGVAIQDRQRSDAKMPAGEYTSAPFRGGGSGSLRLPENEVPEVACDSPSQWANIQSYGAVSNDSGKTAYFGSWTDAGDDSAAIQAAIDSGAGTVYFPNGIWQIGKTIHIRGNVRRLALLHSTLQFTAAFAQSGAPVFRFENGAAPVVVLEQFETDYGDVSGNVVEHASSRTLVLRQAAINATTPAEAYTTVDGGTGDVYFEDVTLNPVKIAGQKAWLRQFNPEGSGRAHLVNDGGQVWILGMKTEGVAQMIETRNGGKTEVLGALLGSTDYVPPDLAAIVNHNAHVSIVAATGIDPAAQQDLVVSETISSDTRTLRSADFMPRAANVPYPWDGSSGPAGAFWVYSSP